MKTVLLARDTSCDLPVSQLADALNTHCSVLRFEASPTQIDLGKAPLSNPRTYHQIRPFSDPLLKVHSSIIVATNYPYDNNYFWDSDDAVVITSFFGWRDLTKVPLLNGFLGFILHLSADDLLVNPPAHDTNSGCLYDFFWDKSGIDISLKAGVICQSCTRKITAAIAQHGTRRLELFDCSVSEAYDDLLTLLEDLAIASRREEDILSYWAKESAILPPTLDSNKLLADQALDGSFDVFLCHNSLDKPSVRTLYEHLVRKGIKPWLDEEHLAPGVPWQDQLQAAIPKMRAVAVVVGPNGQGPWQDFELRAFLAEFVRTGCRVIPVILADAPSVPELPLFLRQFPWVDFRRTDLHPMDRLIWGVTGVRPNQTSV